jgi:hypothetical protein
MQSFRLVTLLRNVLTSSAISNLRISRDGMSMSRATYPRELIPGIEAAAAVEIGRLRAAG